MPSQTVASILMDGNLPVCKVMEMAESLRVDTAMRRRSPRLISQELDTAKHSIEELGPPRAVRMALPHQNDAARCCLRFGSIVELRAFLSRVSARFL